MFDLKAYKNVQNSVDVFEDCKARNEESIGVTLFEILENPMQDRSQELEAYQSNISMLDCLIELAKSGLDLIKDVNNPDIAKENLTR